MTAPRRRRLLGILAPQRGWIALGVLLSVVAIAANVALLAVSAFLISRAAQVTNVAELALAITGVRVLAIGRAAFRYLERYVTHLTTFRILTDMRAWFYGAIEPLAPARLSTYRRGDLLTRIVADIETLDDLTPRAIVPVGAAILVALLGAVVLAGVDPGLGLVFLIGMGVAGVAVPVAIRRRSTELTRRSLAMRAETHAMLVDEIAGIADLIAFDAADRHRAATLRSGEATDRVTARLAAVRATGGAVAAMTATLCAVAVLVVAIPLVGAGRLDGVLLAALPLAALACFEATQPLSSAVQFLDAGRAAADRLFELVDVPPPTRDPAAPAIPPEHVDLEVEGLRFRYEPDGPLVLDGLTLSVPAGTSLAILGPSGAGKSTLVNLLLRFWDYDSGAIRIGGHDLHDYAADAVRGMIGVVSQRVDLFDATIRDNLALADAEVTDERIEAVCRQVQLDPFIRSLPLGYATPVGEDGVRLSGGERQRLAIARAIIRDAPILILDEATANLDVPTERRLMEAIAPFMAGRTTLIISHRTSMIAYADAAVVIEAGRARPLAREPAT